MKVPQVGVDSPDGDSAWVRSNILNDVSALNDVVSNPSWEGEQRKGERALFVFWDTAGAVRVILKVGQPAVKLSTQANSLDDALAALDLCLQEDTPPWQSDERPLKGPPKKKK